MHRHSEASSSQVKGAGRPQGTRQNDMQKLMPQRAEWHTAALSEVKAELQLKCFHAV